MRCRLAYRVVDKSHPVGRHVASARTKQSRPDISKQIVEQATRLFAAKGFFGASLRDIASAVGIRKPSLLYHFSSKDELRSSVLEQMLAHWSEVVPRILRAATSGDEQFDAIAQETLSFFREDPDRARLLLRELLDRPTEIKPLIATHIQPWARIVCDYIRKGQLQGRVYPDVDPEAYVTSTINLVLSNVAVYAATDGLLTPPGTTKRKAKKSQDIPPRVLDEVMRIAKVSLFIPQD